LADEVYRKLHPPLFIKMLPNFDENGFLPEGIWECSLKEFRRRFAVFRRSDRRLHLFANLEEFLDEIHKTKWVNEIIIDGSFVTNKDEPNDIDILLALDSNKTKTEMPFWIESFLNQSQLRKKYMFDVISAFYQSPKYYKNLDFFQQVRQSKLRKGVVRLIL
jgi:predicted nucleotidyltransferase